MQNVTIHPALAERIAGAITQRSLASEMIHRVVNVKTDDYKHDDFLFWRGEHIDATRKLAAFGIKLHTYSGEVYGGVEVLQ